MTRSRQRFSINCNICKVLFYVASYRKDTAKYCSRKCQAKGYLSQETKNCEICTKPFEYIACRANKAKYCSRKCYHKGQITKGTITKTCAHCDKPYLTSPSKAKKRQFCSISCLNKSHHSVWKPGFGFVRNKMKDRGMLTCCERCGYNECQQILGVHHKDRNRRNNELNNLEVLCPNCHSLEHMHHLPHGFKE